MIQKYRQITDAERAELESIGWWDHFDFADVLKIDLETSFEFIHGRGQLLEQGAIEQHPETQPGATPVQFRFVKPRKPN